MKRGENLKEVREATQFPHNDPTKGGRKPSIKKQLYELLEKDGLLKIEAEQVESIDPDGSVIVRIATELQLAMMLQQWALSKKGNDSLKAIQMIMEQIDGKPKQKVAIEDLRLGEDYEAEYE